MNFKYKFKYKNAFKFTYFVIQQISVGCISWIIFPYDFFDISMLKFFYSAILIISVMIPCVYINDHLLGKSKMCRFLQSAIPIIVFIILYFKIGQPIIKITRLVVW